MRLWTSAGLLSRRVEDNTPYRFGSDYADLRTDTPASERQNHFCSGISCPGTLHSGRSLTALMVYSPPAGQTGNFLFKNGSKSSSVGVADSSFLLSSAHMRLARSIIFKLFVQATFCALDLAL